MKKNLPAASAVFCALYLARLRSSRKRPHLKALLLKKSCELKESCERKALSHFFLKNPIHAICGGRESGAGAFGRAGFAWARLDTYSLRESNYTGALVRGGAGCAKKGAPQGGTPKSSLTFCFFLRPCMRARVCLACGRVRRRWAGGGCALFFYY